MQGQCIDITMQWQTSCIALLRLLLLEDVGLPVPLVVQGKMALKMYLTKSWRRRYIEYYVSDR